MKRSLEDFKNLIKKLGVGEEILNNPKFSDIMNATYSETFSNYFSDDGVFVKEERGGIVISVPTTGRKMYLWKNIDQLVVTLLDGNDKVIHNCKVESDNDGNLIWTVGNFIKTINQNGLEVESSYKSENIQSGLRRMPNGYIGQIYCNVFEGENIVKRAIGYVNLDLRYSDLLYGAGYHHEDYEQVCNSIKSGVTYFSPEDVEKYLGEFTLSQSEARAELMARMTDGTINKERDFIHYNDPAHNYVEDNTPHMSRR